MAKYTYIGETPMFYPMYWGESAPEGADSVNLYALPGDVVDFPVDAEGNPIVPPGLWAPYEPPAAKTKTQQKAAE